jgi:predicted RNase H-like nuclease (RuvC/YqgF family)
MASTNKLNKADKPVDQSEGFTDSTAVIENTGIQEAYESGMNTAESPFKEMPVDGDNATNSSTEQPTEIQQFVDTELKELAAEIEALKTQIKDKQKRVRELQKKPASNGPTKKAQAENWLVAHPDTTLLDFINYAVGELDISPVYANTVFKQVQKPKTK